MFTQSILIYLFDKSMNYIIIFLNSFIYVDIFLYFRILFVLLLLAQPRWYQTLKDGTTKHAPNASSLLRETVYLYFVQMDMQRMQLI
jgi:hypothetical protein